MRGEQLNISPCIRDFFLLRDDTTVILIQTRFLSFGILQENYGFRVAVVPQQFFSFTINGRTKLPSDIR